MLSKTRQTNFWSFFQRYGIVTTASLIWKDEKAVLTIHYVGCFQDCWWPFDTSPVTTTSSPTSGSSWLQQDTTVQAPITSYLTCEPQQQLSLSHTILSFGAHPQPGGLVHLVSQPSLIVYIPFLKKDGLSSWDHEAWWTSPKLPIVPASG